GYAYVRMDASGRGDDHLRRDGCRWEEAGVCGAVCGARGAVYPERRGMKAAVWHGRQDVRIERVAEPSSPPPGQVQVKVAWCGICGTDLHEYTGGPLYIPLGHPHPKTGVQAPVIIGHEMSGEVVAVGEGVENFATGDRI